MRPEPPHGSVLNEIHHRFGDFPKALARVAQYILTNPEKVAVQTLSDLATASGSGQASVLRFVQALGFDGFGAFKTALNIELSHRPAPVGTGDTAFAQMVETLAAQSTADANATAACLADSDIDAAAQHIAAARQVWICGSGISGILADILRYRLLRQGVAANAFHDPILLRELMDTVDASTVAIAISDSGSTPFATRFLQEARQKDAYTIAITSRATSTLAESAHCLLQTGTTGSFDIYGNILGVTTRAAIVIEALGRCVEQTRR